MHHSNHIDPIFTPFTVDQVALAAATLDLQVRPSDYMVAPRRSIDLQPHLFGEGIVYSSYYDLLEYLIFLSLIGSLEYRHSEFEVAAFAKDICEEFAEAVNAGNSMNIQNLALPFGASTVVSVYVCLTTVLRAIEHGLKLNLYIIIEQPLMPTTSNTELAIDVSWRDAGQKSVVSRMPGILLAKDDASIECFS